MDENMAIKEKDIFASVVAPDVMDEVMEKEVNKNIRDLLTYIPENIFTNEYFAIYQAIKDAKSYNVILSYRHFNQVVLNNIEKLIQSENVNVYDFASDPRDEDLTKQEFVNICCLTYEELAKEPLNSSRLVYNMKLYLEEYVSDKIREYTAKSYKIASEGLKVGKKFMQGPLEAHRYYIENTNKTLRLLEGEDKRLENILVAPGGYQDYLESIEDGQKTQAIARTGVGYIDENIGEFRRGDVVAILGPTGAGKTRFAVDVCHEAVLNGKGGVYFALEGHPRRTLSLFIARHLAVKYNCDRVDGNMIFERTYPSELDELVKTAEYDLFYNKEYGRFKIIPSPVYDEDIDGILQDVDENEFTVDWACLDHTSLIATRTKDSVTGMLTDLMPKLETMAQSFKGRGIMLVLPHQLKNDAVEALMQGVDKTIIGSADSSAVNKSAHVVLTIYTDETLKLVDKAKVICTKTRNTQGFPAIEVYANLSVCVFADLPD